MDEEQHAALFNEVMGLRPTFFRELFELAKKDKSIVLVTADMGYNMLEEFRDKLPSQYVNAGISEANAVSLAAGMALYGKKVFVYSITPFVSYRCLEQVRLDVCYQDVDVKIIGAGGGLDYAQSGPTHQPTEDISMMRSLPNMRVACPADPIEAAALPKILCGSKRPFYVKLGRGKEPRMHTVPPIMKMGAMLPLYEGNGPGMKILMLATGSIAFNALQAAKKLTGQGLSVSLFSVPWLKPFDAEFFAKQASSASLVVTIEEHTPFGGLHSAACEAAQERGVHTSVKRISLQDSFQKEVGSRDFLLLRNNLDSDSIANQVRSFADGGK